MSKLTAADAAAGYTPVRHFASAAETRAALANPHLQDDRIALGGLRIHALCDGLTSGSAEEGSTVRTYWKSTYRDQAELRRRYPRFARYTRDLDRNARLMQLSVSPDFLRNQCKKLTPWAPPNDDAAR